MPSRACLPLQPFYILAIKVRMREPRRPMIIPLTQTHKKEQKMSLSQLYSASPFDVTYNV